MIAKPSYSVDSVQYLYQLNIASSLYITEEKTPVIAQNILICIFAKVFHNISKDLKSFKS